MWPARLPASKQGLFVLALSTLFLAAHLPFLAPAPGTVDGANFALAVREFDLADHRPHPPGYPIFVALGKISYALVTVAPDGADTAPYEARALALWSALFGAFAVLPLFTIFRCLELDDRRATAATALTVTCPLFWFMAIRPMSDTPGLGAALISQALVFSAYRRQELGQARRAGRLLILGALASGLALGLRSQTGWVTMPALVLAVVRQIRANRGAEGHPIAAATAAFPVGVLLWALPLLLASGGVSAYLSALTAQADEDFAHVDMLIANLTPRRVVQSLVLTFAYPWANKYLALFVIGMATLGALAMAVRSRQAFLWLATASAPYAVFHLLYQDHVMTRYALPLVPAMSYLAVRGVEVIARRALVWCVAPLAAASVLIAAPPVVAYASTGSPGFQALADVRQRLGTGREPRPVLAMHHAIARVVRGERLGAAQLPAPPKHEWLGLVQYWRDGGSAPVWFFAEPGRTDLALIDRASLRLASSYRFPFDNRLFMKGARPAGIDWYEIVPPGWAAGEGWALTPETAGVAFRDRRGPAHGTIVAIVRRRADAAVMLIGGRHLGPAAAPAARFAATLDGQPLASWIVDPAPGFFLQTIQLPRGSLGGRDGYAELGITATPADGSRAPLRASVEQFDVQGATVPLWGFDAGWFEQEYDPTAARLWRWTGRQAILRIHSGGRDVTIRIAGDSPLKYFDRPPAVTLRAGPIVLGRFAPTADFVFHAQATADALSKAGDSLVLETDLTFVPHDRLQNGDRRSLGLRIFDVSVYPSSHK